MFLDYMLCRKKSNAATQHKLPLCNCTILKLLCKLFLDYVMAVSQPRTVNPVAFIAKSQDWPKDYTPHEHVWLRRSYKRVLT